jgi:hypothetical protein
MQENVIDEIIAGAPQGRRTISFLSVRARARLTAFVPRDKIQEPTKKTAASRRKKKRGQSKPSRSFCGSRR